MGQREGLVYFPKKFLPVNVRQVGLLLGPLALHTSF